MEERYKRNFRFKSVSSSGFDLRDESNHNLRHRKWMMCFANDHNPDKNLVRMVHKSMTCYIRNIYIRNNIKLLRSK